MPRKFAGFVLAVCIIAPAGLAQTTTELLQKGIFAQETEGNLDNAILIYRQIVNSAPAQRDLAAQAQFRLGQALLQKGDLTSAAQEFDKLARDYADYRNLVGSLSEQGFQKRRLAVAETSAFLGVPPAMQTLSAMTFDESKPVKFVGVVVALYMLNPTGAIMVKSDQSMRFFLLTAAACDMMQQGFNRTTLKPGDTVEVTGVLSAGGQMLENALAGRADTISLNGQKTVFDRSTLKVGTAAAPPDQVVAERKVALSELIMRMGKTGSELSVLRTQYGDNSPEVVGMMRRLSELQMKADALKKEINEGK
jgi:tetratricopeptide (TPR) repeat protein